MKKFFTFLSLGLFVLSLLAVICIEFYTLSYKGDGAWLMGVGLLFAVFILPIHIFSFISVLIISWFKYQVFSFNQKKYYCIFILLPFLCFYLFPFLYSLVGGNLSKPWFFYLVLIYTFSMIFALVNIFVVWEHVNTINKVFKIITILALVMLVISYALYYFSIGLSNYI